MNGIDSHKLASSCTSKHIGAMLKARSLHLGLTEGCRGGHGELRKEAGP